MKIYLNQIPRGGLALEEKVSPQSLDLEIGEIKFRGPVFAKVFISKITNAVSVDLELKAAIYTVCSRCLKEIDLEINKKLKLSYQVDSSARMIDLDPDIREEIILEYPLKPLCKDDCKGLCFKCGKSLNEGGCSCGIT